MKHYLPIFILFLILGLAGCGPSNEETTSDDGKLHIYTSVYPLKYFAEEIGKEYVSVETIYPPGADEHTFEPSQKDMIELADSDLFIYVGLGLEGFVNKAKGTLENEDVILLAAGEHIHLEEHEEEEHHDEEEENHDHHDHHHGDIDPHVWIDPIFAKGLAESIKDELSKQLPDQKSVFEENYSTLATKLEELDEKFKHINQSSEHKEIIVAHAAYGYWHRYGIEQHSISGLSSSSEPTQKELKEIIDIGKEKDIDYVFFEQNISSRLAETVQKEMGAEPLILHNLSVLTEEDIKQNRNYFSIMEDNIKALETAVNN